MDTKTFKLFFVCCVCTLFFVQDIFSQVQTTEQLANQYFNNKEYKKSSTLYEQIYKSDKNAFYYKKLLECYINLNNFDNAEKLIKQRIKQKPKDLTLFVDWGCVLEKKGKTKQAEKKYEEVFSHLGYNSSEIENLAEAFENINRIDLAITTYKKAGEKIHNSQAYAIQIAQLYEKQSDYEKEFDIYFDYLKQYPYAKHQVQIFLQQSTIGSDNTKYETALKNTLAKYINNNPQNTVFHEMMIWFSIQKKDFDFALKQAKALDLRFPEDNGSQVFQVATIALSDSTYTSAINGFQYLIKKGKNSEFYNESKVGLLNAKFSLIDNRYQHDIKQIDALLSEYEATFEDLGKNPNTTQLMRNYAQLQAIYKNNIDIASNTLYDIIDMRGVPDLEIAETKLQLADIMLVSGKIWDATLLYMQVEKAHKNDIVGSVAKLKNAQLSYYNADFEWAKSQLNVLRASTSKLVANDAMQLSLLISDNIDEDSTFSMLEYFAKGDMMMYQKKYEKAINYYDTITIKKLSHPLFDEILMRKSQIAMKQGQYKKADSLLTKIVELYPNDILADDAIFQLATLNENFFKNLDKAKLYYEKILLEYPSSLYVVEARKNYNLLKNR